MPLAPPGGPHWLVIAFLFTAGFVSGLGLMLLDILAGALQARLVPPPIRSRVSGAFMVVNYGAPLGTTLAGILGTTIGVHNTIWVGAGGALLGMAFLLLLADPADQGRAGSRRSSNSRGVLSRNGLLNPPRRPSAEREPDQVLRAALTGSDAEQPKSPRVLGCDLVAEVPLHRLTGGHRPARVGVGLRRRAEVRQIQAAEIPGSRQRRKAVQPGIDVVPRKVCGADIGQRHVHERVLMPRRQRGISEVPMFGSTTDSTSAVASILAELTFTRQPPSSITAVPTGYGFKRLPGGTNMTARSANR